MAETPAEQMIGSGSVDSDRGQESGPQFVTEAAVAAEVGRRDNPDPKPQPPADNGQDDKMAKDLQKVQQEQSARRQLQEKLEGKVDSLADMFERFITSNKDQQPASALMPDGEPERKAASSGKVVEEAFSDIDMLDSDAVQSAMTKVLDSVGNSPSPDSGLRQELNDLKSQLDAMGGHIQQDKASQYWSDFKDNHGLSDDQLANIQSTVHDELSEVGWYERGTEGYEGAFHASVLAHAKSQPGSRSQAPKSSGRSPTPGTDVVPQGVSARTGIPIGDDGGVELTPPEALWQADND